MRCKSFRAQVKEKPGHMPLCALKLLKANPAEVQARAKAVKARYAKLFGV